MNPAALSPVFHVEHPGPEVHDADSFAAASGAAPEAMADLERFRRLLAERSAQLNLVGPSALAEFWPRHAWDSAQLSLAAPEAVTFADLGAGAGFPGVVLAILLKHRPGAQVHLVESLAKRCRFLAEAAEVLALPAQVHNVRAEAIAPAPEVEIVTARACAPLTRLLGYAEPFFRAGAVGLFLKGRSAEAEVVDAQRAWRFRSQLIPSLSDAEGRIVRVEALSRVR